MQWTFYRIQSSWFPMMQLQKGKTLILAIFWQWKYSKHSILTAVQMGYVNTWWFMCKNSYLCFKCIFRNNDTVFFLLWSEISVKLMFKFFFYWDINYLFFSIHVVKGLSVKLIFVFFILRMFLIYRWVRPVRKSERVLEAIYQSALMPSAFY